MAGIVRAAQSRFALGLAVTAAGFAISMLLRSPPPAPPKEAPIGMIEAIPEDQVVHTRDVAKNTKKREQGDDILEDMEEEEESPSPVLGGDPVDELDEVDEEEDDEEDEEEEEVEQRSGKMIRPPEEVQPGESYADYYRRRRKEIEQKELEEAMANDDSYDGDWSAPSKRRYLALQSYKKSYGKKFEHVKKKRAAP